MSNLLLTAGFLIILVISIVWGLLRGLAKARIRGISILLCAAAAVGITLMIRPMIDPVQIVNEVLIPLLENNGQSQMTDMLTLSETLNEVLLHAVISLISPVICLVLFILLSFLTWFIYAIVTLVLHGVLRRANARSAFHRLRGSAGGAIQGLVLVVILLIHAVQDLFFKEKEA